MPSTTYGLTPNLALQRTRTAAAVSGKLNVARAVRVR